MSKVKGWLIDIAIKKFGPSAIRGAVLGIAGFFAARHEILEPLGIMFDAATNILTVDFNKVSVWAIAALPAIGAGVIKVLNHEGNVVAKKVLPVNKPESNTSSGSN